MPVDTKAMGADIKRRAEDKAVQAAIEALSALCQSLGRTVLVLEVPKEKDRVMDPGTMDRLAEALGDRYTVVDNSFVNRGEDPFAGRWRCTGCGAIGPAVVDSTWRWAAECGWQHKCPGSGQAGHIECERIKDPSIREVLEMWMDAVEQVAMDRDGSLYHQFMSTWEPAFPRLVELGLAEYTDPPHNTTITLDWSGLDKYGPAPVTDRAKEMTEVEP